MFSSIWELLGMGKPTDVDLSPYQNAHQQMVSNQLVNNQYGNMLQQQLDNSYAKMVAQQNLQQAVLAQIYVQGWGGTVTKPKFDPSWRMRYELERARAALQRELEWT